MANSAQAKKRIIQAEKHRQHNTSMRSKMRTYIKKVLKAIQAGNKPEAQTAYQEAVSVIDRTASKGIIHANKAARHKSRLNQRIRNLPS
ncbi:MAG: 30S ribosomal protein S20 [Candidatus Competibacteraceae bacterium]|nr:30S ribosomal protein S20 [Candidatus Competibacteraceae bacterium]